MSISAMRPESSGYPQMAQPEKDSGRTLTTVTTHCDKDHWHTRACPHTVVTRKADNVPGLGENLDVYA